MGTGEVAGPAAPGPGPRAARGAASRQGRVLVVEDEPDVLELVRYRLTRDGWEVLTARDGAEALRRAREARPDVVLLDLVVPQPNGWGVCRRLRQDAETRQVPVIMVGYGFGEPAGEPSQLTRP